MLGPQDIQLGVNESMKDTGTIFRPFFYVCMHVYTYVCIYMYVLYLCQLYICMYVCMYVCLMAEP